MRFLCVNEDACFAPRLHGVVASFRFVSDAIGGETKRNGVTLKTVSMCERRRWFAYSAFSARGIPLTCLC